MVRKKLSAKERKRLKSFKPKKIEVVAAALVESMLSGDKEAFLEILKGYIRSREILGLSTSSKQGQRTILEALDQFRNPSIGTICDLMKLLADQQQSQVKSDAAQD